MSFPREIMEVILMKCDGKTLLNALHVCPEWNDIIQYLSKKTRIWEWCCKEDISRKELLDYFQNYNENDRDRWFKIYSNWAAWENISDNIICDTILCPVELQRVSCIAFSGKYIAVGSDVGRVKIFTENWKPIFVARFQAVKITHINFINFEDQEDEEEDEDKLFFMLAYPKALYFAQVEDISDHIIVQGVKSHSLHKNYVCYEQLGGRITIARLTNADGRIQLEEIWYDRVYSPSHVSCMNIWNGVCTVLIDKEVKTVEYSKNMLVPVGGLEKKTKIKFTLHDNTSDFISQIIRDDIIIASMKHECRDEYVEFFILGEKNEFSQKLFYIWDIFQAFVTLVFVYGNTLILGTDTGIAYFYNVSSWKHFDMRNHQKKIIIGKHPLINVAVKEVENERVFYIASSYSVHKVTGFSCTEQYYKKL